MESKKYCFLDTNSLLHYHLFTDLQWSEFIGTKNIVLVISTTVLRELDQKKFSARQIELKNRAQLVIKKLSELLTSTDTSIPINKNVDIFYFSGEPKINWDEENLDSSLPDDRIIATILEAAFPLRDVLLLSSDLGIKLKAKGKGISCASIPDKFLLKNNNDTKQREIDKLKQRIQFLENRLPSLSIKLFSSGEATFFKKYILTPIIAPMTQEEIDEQIEKLKNELQNTESASDGSTIGGILSSFNASTKEEIERYEQEVKEYLIKMTQYFEREFEVRKIISRKITIELIIENQGTIPAEDIDIFLHFPDGFKLFSEDISIESLEKPTMPIRPRSHSEMLSSLSNFNIHLPNFDRMSTINNVDKIDFNAPSKPTIIKTNSYDVKYELNKIKHGFQISLDPLFLVFDSIESARSFKIDYSILAGNLPEPANGELNIIIEKNISS